MTHLNPEQRAYAAMLLREGVPPEDVAMAARIARCSMCEETVLEGTLDASGRCEECAP